MKWPKKMLSACLLSLSLLSGCGAWRDFDKPHPDPGEYWKKPGYREEGVRKFLFQHCGYGYNITWDELNKAETCMLANGFTFHDIRYAGKYTCDFPIYQDLPSCQSIRRRQ